MDGDDMYENEWGVVDYRKDGHVDVTEDADKNEYIITLRFYVRQTGEKNISATEESILEAWLKKWSIEQVVETFTYIYDVKGSCWKAPGVLELRIEKPLNHRDEVVPLDRITDEFRYDSLEDGAYEGGCSDYNFWCIPYSFVEGLTV